MKKRITRKCLAVIPAAAMALCMMAGFGALSVSAAEAGTDTIAVAYYKPVDSFSPVGVLPDQTTTSNIFEPLWRNVENETVPCIARSWNWEEDMVLDVEINDNVYDSAGNHITASDVLFCLQTLKEIDSDFITFVDVENSEVISDTEIKIHTLNPAQENIFNNLGYVWIYSQAAFEATDDTMALDPVGTGPYVLGEYVANSHCMLDYNENWWAASEEEPQIKHVKVMFVADPAQRLNVLLSKDVCYSYALNFTDDVIIQATDGLESVIETSTNQLGIYFNMSSPVIGDNLKLRQAICYAIDRSAINMISCQGLANEAYAIGASSGADYTPEFIEGIESFSGDTGWYSYDMDKAKELLAESGVEPGTKFRFVYYTTSGMDTLAKYLEGVFQELGLVLDLDFQSNNAAYIGKLMDPDGYDITPLSLVSDPIALWMVYGSSGLNLIKWPEDGEDFETVSGLSLMAYALSAGEERTQTLLALEQMYYDNCWEFPIYDDVELEGKVTGTEQFFNEPLYPDFTKWVVQ